MLYIPSKITHIIFSFISFCKKDWLNIKLSSKQFKIIADKTFLPTFNHFIKAVKAANIFSLKTILSYNIIDLSQHNNDAFKIAISYGNISNNYHSVFAVFSSIK